MLTNFANGNGMDWSGKRPEQIAISFNNVNITPDYGHTIGWRILSGREDLRRLKCRHPADHPAYRKLPVAECGAYESCPQPADGVILVFFELDMIL